MTTPSVKAHLDRLRARYETDPDYRARRLDSIRRAALWGAGMNSPIPMPDPALPMVVLSSELTGVTVTEL